MIQIDHQIQYIQNFIYQSITEMIQIIDNNYNNNNNNNSNNNNNNNKRMI